MTISPNGPDHSLLGKSLQPFGPGTARETGPSLRTRGVARGENAQRPMDGRWNLEVVAPSAVPGRSKSSRDECVCGGRPQNGQESTVRGNGAGTGQIILARRPHAPV